MKIEKLDNFNLENLLEAFDEDGTIFLESQNNTTSPINQFSFLCIRPISSLKQGIDDKHDLEQLNTIDEFIHTNSHIHNPTKYPFIGGYVGFISYDFKESVFQIDSTKDSLTNTPYLYFNLYEAVIIHDLKTGELFLSCLELQNSFDFYLNCISKAKAQKHLDVIKDECRAISCTQNIDKDDYLSKLKIVHDEIENGNVYQINFTYPVSGMLNCDNYLFLYTKLKNINPAPFAAYIRDKDFTICSSSPERFIRVKDRLASICPIKGTINKTDDPKINESNKEKLSTSQKDRSELLMIVDLERNDLSKISTTGSVKVPRLFDIEQYPTLYHLVSEVTGTLDKTTSFSDIVKSLFPGGSITGAPKKAAIELIDRLEKYKRGLYTGAIGYININGDLDFSIVIRTIYIEKNKYTLNVGGGIVWDSNNEYEYEECKWKSRALLEALGVSDYQ